MKRISILFLALLALAPSIIPIPSGVNLIPGSQAITSTNVVNSALTNCPGFMLGTNDSPFIRWQFPAEKIIGTNFIANFQIETTNSTVAIACRVWLSFFSPTNLVYSTNQLLLNATLSSTGTNFNYISWTNNFPTAIYNTNIVFGYVSFQGVPVAGQPNFNIYLVGGKLLFY